MQSMRTRDRKLENVDNWKVIVLPPKLSNLSILKWPRGFSDNIENFSRLIVSKYPEETWAQRKPNQVQKNDHKASESC